MFFSRLFKKRKAQPKEEYLDPELDIEAEFSKRNNGGGKEYEIIEQMQYVNTQCEQIADSSRYIAELKAEYQIVNNYIEDVKKIEDQPENIRKSICSIVETIKKLQNRRESIKNSAPLVSGAKYALFEKYQKEFPKAPRYPRFPAR